MPDATGPLAGIRVVDFSVGFAVPGAAMYLADQGADVIKVEAPNSTRVGRNGTYLVYNRGKRAISLDLRSPDGMAVAHDLVRRADVMMATSPPGELDRRGLGYAAMSALNSRLIYASITGWGNNGPDRMKRGADYVVQAYSGIMASQPSSDGTPSGTAWYPADMSIPMYLPYAIMLALWQRETTGVGQHVETTQLQAQLAMQMIHLVHNEQGEPLDDQVAGTSIAWSWRRPAHTYQASDGKWIALVGLNNDEWRRLWGILELGEFPSDPRITGIWWPPDLIEAHFEQIQARIRTRGRDEWVAILEANDFGPVISPVLTREEVMVSPQVVANGWALEQQHPTAGKIRMLGTPFSLSGSPVPKPEPAPEPGQHTDDILRELGHSADAIAALRAKGAVR